MPGKKKGRRWRSDLSEIVFTVPPLRKNKTGCPESESPSPAPKAFLRASAAGLEVLSEGWEPTEPQWDEVRPDVTVLAGF